MGESGSRARHGDSGRRRGAGWCGRCRRAGWCAGKCRAGWAGWRSANQSRRNVDSPLPEARLAFARSTPRLCRGRTCAAPVARPALAIVLLPHLRLRLPLHLYLPIFKLHPIRHLIAGPRSQPKIDASLQTRNIARTLFIDPRFPIYT